MTLELSSPVSTPLPPWTWAQKRLFHNWYNTLLTLGALSAIAWGLQNFLIWATTKAQWVVIDTNLKLLLVGRFPNELLWRLWVVVGIIVVLGGLTWGRIQSAERPWNGSALLVFAGGAVLVAIAPITLPSRLTLAGLIGLLLFSYWLGRSLLTPISRWLPLAWVLSFPALFWLIKGGLGLQNVQTADLSGLLLTLFAAVICMVLAFPLGILLALGRQSTLLLVRFCSILYIEVLRGLPLIGVLFIALVMLPLVLPPQWEQPDSLLRGLAGLTLFSAAYMAEVVRGGLQSVPSGQLEAARALGLNPLLVIGLILLPQALRAIIPAMVGEFVGLFKETTLLSVFGLIELLGISASILANPEFIGRYAEVYLFAGVIYWLFCYGMSIASQRLESQLGVGSR